MVWWRTSMGINKIKLLYSKMIQIPDKTYSFSMITNGFLITMDIIDFLKEMKLQHLQITLDGLKESHNKVKFTKTCNDTFTKTIENIDLLAASAPQIKVVIRVNMNKENDTEFAELYKFITERYKKKSTNRYLSGFCDSIFFRANYQFNVIYQIRQIEIFTRPLL